jgi:cell wall-associated NlpC family hydrolase
MRRGVRRGALVLGVAAVLLQGTVVPVEAAPGRDIAEVEAQVRDLEMRASSANEQLNAAQLKLNRTQEELSAVSNRIKRERSDLAVARASANDLARSVYMSGGMDTTLQILLADNPTDFLAQSAAIDQVAQSQAATMRHTQTARLRLSQSEAELADKEKLAAGYRNEMRQARQDADDSLAQAQAVLASLKEAERKRLEELRRQREREAKAAAAAAAAAARKAAEQSRRQAAAAQQRPVAPQSPQRPSPQQPQSSSQGSTAAAAGGGFSGGGRAAIAIQYALAQVGDRYVAAASGPSSFDCSGLTLAAWRQAGVSLPHYSVAQYSSVRRISDSELQAGDLVFYFGGGAHHVGMYIGNGKMVHAANPRDGVEITDYKGPWYGSHYTGAGRVVG